MDVTFLSNSPLNSTVVDLEGGGHLYDITTKHETESPELRSTTTISRPKGEVVAVWERAYHRDQDRVTYHGKMHTLAGWLPKKSVLSKCVTSFIATTCRAKAYKDEDNSRAGRAEL